MLLNLPPRFERSSNEYVDTFLSEKFSDTAGWSLRRTSGSLVMIPLIFKVVLHLFSLTIDNKMNTMRSDITKRDRSGL